MAHALGESKGEEGLSTELEEVQVECGGILSKLPVDLWLVEGKGKAEAMDGARVLREAVDPREEVGHGERRVACVDALVLDRVTNKLAEAFGAKVA